MIDRRLLISDTKDGMLLRGWKQGDELQIGDRIYGIAIKQLDNISASVKRIKFSIINSSTDELVEYVNNITFVFTQQMVENNLQYGFCSFLFDEQYAAETAKISYFPYPRKQNSYYGNNMQFAGPSFESLTDQQLLDRSASMSTAARTTYGQAGSVDLTIYPGYYMLYPFIFNTVNWGVYNSVGSRITSANVYLRYDGEINQITDEVLFLTESPESE